MQVPEIMPIFAAKGGINMEFIALFFILMALGFILTVLGAAAMLFLKGTVGMVGAVCISFARGMDILKGTVYGQKEKGRLNVEPRFLWAFFIVTYIVILILVSNIS